MGEEAVPETTEVTMTESNTNPTIPVNENMEVETLESAPNSELNGVDSAANGDSKSKREREEGGELEEEEKGDSKSKREREEGGELEEEEKGGVAGEKKQKVEEQSVVDLEGGEGKEEGKSSDQVSLGPKKFGSSVEMFDYFYKFLHFWPPNLQVNKYEHMVLVDLLMKGHAEPDKKIGGGIHAFQVRNHPMWKSRCFFIIRDDESVDDFSFRKCVDQILPLPENMKVKTDANKALGGGGRGGKGGGGRGGGGHSRGRGRGGKWRN